MNHIELTPPPFELDKVRDGLKQLIDVRDTPMGTVKLTIDLAVTSIIESLAYHRNWMDLVYRHLNIQVISVVNFMYTGTNKELTDRVINLYDYLRVCEQHHSDAVTMFTDAMLIYYCKDLADHTQTIRNASREFIDSFESLRRKIADLERVSFGPNNPAPTTLHGRMMGPPGVALGSSLF